MPSYRVLNKFLYRASVVPTRMGTKPDGSPDMVDQPGPMERVEAGTVLDDVTDAELRAFPDRFGPVDAEGESEQVTPDATTHATITARGAARAAEPGPMPEGTTVEQAAAATAARMHPATATAQDQAIGATEETAQATHEESQRGSRHSRRSASD